MEDSLPGDDQRAVEAALSQVARDQRWVLPLILAAVLVGFGLVTL